VATVDDDRRELAGGWVAITDGLISGVGDSTDPMPDAERIIDAGGCLVTPGLVNTHHHLFQNLTRAYPPMTSAPLFGWLQSLYPLWTAAIDEEAEYLAAWVGLAELALSGCTTSSDPRRSRPQSISACVSTRPMRRCRWGRATAASHPTTPCETKTTSSPNPNGPWNAITTAATARWSGLRSPPARRSR